MYERIINLRKEILNSVKGIDDNKSLAMLDSIDNFFECKVYERYEAILDFCKKNGFGRIFDIGCACGLQSETFLDTEIDYVGINEWNLGFWNSDRYKYITKRYPFKVNAKNNDLAVSSLCCYLHNGEKTLREQCEALQRDFKQYLLHVQEDKVDFVSKYFEEIKVLADNPLSKIIYLSNK